MAVILAMQRVAGGMRTACLTPGLAGRGQRFRHDLMDRSRAATALSAAAKASVDLSGRARPVFVGRLTGVADVMVR